jgi:hypothetical protein
MYVYLASVVFGRSQWGATNGWHHTRETLMEESIPPPVHVDLFGC